MKHNIKRISKTLALVLRHRPEKFDLKLDANGWCEVAQLLLNFNAQGIRLDRALLEEVVDTNDKKRFAFSEDGQKIRANQGHSISIDLDYPPSEPPAFLYHGTAERNLAAIKKEGIQKRQRHHVHLSPNKETAIQVGQRHGKAVVLVVDSRRMYQDGCLFYQSKNGVWLTQEVNPAYIDPVLA